MKKGDVGMAKRFSKKYGNKVVVRIQVPCTVEEGVANACI